MLLPRLTKVGLAVWVRVVAANSCTAFSCSCIVTKTKTTFGTLNNTTGDQAKGYTGKWSAMATNTRMHTPIHVENYDNEHIKME